MTRRFIVVRVDMFTFGHKLTVCEISQSWRKVLSTGTFASRNSPPAEIHLHCRDFHWLTPSSLFWMKRHICMKIIVADSLVTSTIDTLTSARSLRSPPAASYKVGNQSVLWNNWLVVRPRFFSRGDQMNDTVRTAKEILQLVYRVKIKTER